MRQGCLHGIRSHVRPWKQGRGVLQGNFSHLLAEWAMTACLHTVA